MDDAEARARSLSDQVFWLRLALEGAQESCPAEWCKRVALYAVSGALGRDVQAATGGSLMGTLSLTGAMDSRVM